MRREFIAALLVEVVLACGAGWHREEIGTEPFAPKQQVQVFGQGSMKQWHGVRLSADSISGIPFTKPLSCDSCRSAVPAASVDSLRLGNPVAGFWKTFSLVVGSMFLFCAVYCRWDEGGT